VLCFNGKRAAQEFFKGKAVDYGPQTERIGWTSVFVAPSTSAAANAFWDMRCWRELAALVQGEAAG
jgi:TDG/mug DNA glycosylase family protein